jgi:hypothetical protein
MLISLGAALGVAVENESNLEEAIEALLQLSLGRVEQIL